MHYQAQDTFNRGSLCLRLSVFNLFISLLFSLFVLPPLCVCVHVHAHVCMCVRVYAYVCVVVVVLGNIKNYFRAIQRGSKPSQQHY